MSFFDEIKTEIQTEQNQKSNLAEQVSAAQAPQAASEPAPTAPVLPERMPEFVQEELKTLQETIRQDARSGKYQTVGGKHLFPPLARGRLPSGNGPACKLLSVSVSRPDAGKGNSDTEQTPLFRLPLRGTLYAFQRRRLLFQLF